MVSPDGRYVLKLTHRGVLAEGVTEGTIWLFDVGSIKRSVNDRGASVPPPIPLLRMSAAANGLFNGLGVFDTGNIIFQPQWVDDSRSVTFLGRNGRENRQLFRVNLGTRALTALTPENQDVLIYARAGESYVYLAGANVQPEQSWWSAGPGIPDITIGTGTPLMPLLYPHFMGNAFSEPVELEVWQIRDDKASAVVDAQSKTALRIITKYTAVALDLSPDGMHAATIAYESPPEKADRGGRSLQYRLINLTSGANDVLLNVPVADFQWHGLGRYRTAWSSSGTDVAMSEVMLPVGSGQAGADDAQPCTVAVVTLLTRDASCIVPHDDHAPGSIYSLHWGASPESIRLRYRRSGGSAYVDVTLRHKGGVWSAAKSPKSRTEVPLELTVHESLNEPPVLVATDTVTHKSRAIFDPNPQLAQINLGTVSVYRWRDSHGRTNQGGLVKPPDFVAGQRYPLVIQTHGFDADRFFRAGYSDTSNAGRALASRDIVVLQVDEPSPENEPSWRDGKDLGTDVYLAAIDQLAAEGIIDPKKVGITGYSYSGWLVATSITRAPERFAAAEIANSDPVTLTGYFEYVDTPLAKADAEAYVGARPYGEGLKTWIERVPSLATDKIQAPVLFQAADPWHLLAFWDMYAAMRDQGKPVELQYIRSGQHNITKPLHKLAHQEMIVDWFDFWLNGHEDAAAGKAGQYARWRQLRESRQSSNDSVPVAGSQH